MKIKSIKRNTRKVDVFDIETPTHDYILANRVISHNTQEMYSKAVISGGQGVLLAANTAWIIGRQQEKDGTDTIGYNFIINVEKSRFVKEKSKIPISVTFDGGISKWSGLMDLALESGHVIKPNVGWYQKPGDDKKYRLADTNTSDFWLPIIQDNGFQKFVESKYKLDSPNEFETEEVQLLLEGEEDDSNEV